MSRIGKLPVKVPKGVKLNISGSEIKVEGPKGKLAYNVPREISFKQSGEEVVFEIKTANAEAQALWGLSRTIVNNMLHGVATGYTKTLEINGLGFKAVVKGKVLNLTLGFSHDVNFDIPEGITMKVEQNKVVITGCDKYLVGETAAKVRALREPEPYQGKGIKYLDEVIIRKAGKAAGSGGK